MAEKMGKSSSRSSGWWNRQSAGWIGSAFFYSSTDLGADVAGLVGYIHAFTYFFFPFPMLPPVQKHRINK